MSAELLERPTGDACAADARRGRVAVIDIGSNSIRLVVYDRLWRSPVPQFNEKVLCGLGRSLTATGRLSDQAMALALRSLVRFTRLAEAMHAEDIDLFATEAVRAADNGTEFVAEVERRCGRPVEVVTGEEEARLAALGVLAGTERADGLMGDLGGGSLELAELDGRAIGRLASLPLGPLRLADAARGDLKAARAIVDRHLEALAWPFEHAGRELHLVGGSWRALARLHMTHSRYPLRIIQGYALARAEAEVLVGDVAGLARRGLADRAGVSRKRIETLPMAAVVLERLIACVCPERVLFSAFGLREGRLFARLSVEEQARDPLLATAAELGARDRRFDLPGEALCAWLDPLFAAEDAGSRRLRLAACHLSDIAWREHPDYRAEQALGRILLLPTVGVSHGERALIALAVYARYDGDPGARAAAGALRLLSPEQRRQAILLGRALRLAHMLCAGTRAILDRSRLVLEGGRLRLVLPDDGSVPEGEALERRFRALARALAQLSSPRHSLYQATKRRMPSSIGTCGT